MYLKIFSASLIYFLFIACSANKQDQSTAMGDEERTLNPIQRNRHSPENGLGAVQGRILDYPSIWKNERLYVYAAHFYGDGKNSNGLYLLEPNLAPHTTIDRRGFFLLNNLNPGAYILIVGPSNPEHGRPLRTSDTQIRIFSIKGDTILQLGPTTVRK